MVTTSAKYVIDGKGKKKAVLLDMKEYSRLLSRMEELEDALDLDTAVRTSREFMDYQQVREELHTF
ncbi:MAG: hypothetical protein V1767_01845 [Chloroflexota bacterium]